MSKIEISFNIINYKPNYFNFNEYYFEFVCDETNFKDIIEYSKKNIITNKTEIKSNLKYFIKVFYKKELIGLTNFLIPQKYLFKNKKSFSININNLKLTMSEFHLKKLFPNNNNDNNLGISIDIKISFKFIQKKINFSHKKISNYKINKTKNFLYNYNNIYNNTSNYNNYNNNEFKTHRETSLNSTINTNRSAKTPIYMRKKLNNMNYSENKNNQKSLKNNFIYINNNKNNENDDEDDLTVIDSILIDNEYTYENDNETNDLKKKLNFNTINNNEIPNDKDLINLIEKTKDKYFDNLIEKNKELNNVCERHCKLIKSLNNYQNKLKEIKIKKIKIENKINSNNINNIIANFNKNQNDFINKHLDIKEKENKLFDELYFYLEDNINKNNNFYTNNNNNSLNKKELLIKSIKNIMDLDVDLDKCFEPEEIKKFQNICEKYGIIESLSNNY
jgi:hypothetical protein